MRDNLGKIKIRRNFLIEGGILNLGHMEVQSSKAFRTEINRFLHVGVLFSHLDEGILEKGKGMVFGIKDDVKLCSRFRAGCPAFVSV